jgi:hypothetical protein
VDESMLDNPILIDAASLGFSEVILSTPNRIEENNEIVTNIMAIFSIN